MKRYQIIFLGLSLLCGCPAWSMDLTSGRIRDQAQAHILNRTQNAGISEFEDILSSVLNANPSLNSRSLTTLTTAADCIQLMKLTEKATLDGETLRWILDSDSRTRQLAETIHPSDDTQQVFWILKTLFENDPKGRDEYFELMLAISLVWDRPDRGAIHSQMGDKTLAYRQEVLNRYNYFKTLYAEDEAKVSYDHLGVNELLFVVETPLPISELEWARENEDGSLKKWGEKFSDIEYDHGRLEAGQYRWSNGMYTLAAIRNQGGICVDQAYYAVMTARAYGIPAIYFSGMGRSGGHAWFSYMVRPGDWVLDVGRYEGQDYTTGKAIHPQTNRKMTDHDVEYACDRALHSSEYRKACSYISIARALQNDVGNVERCARAARKLADRHLEAWNLEMDALLAQGKLKDLVQLCTEHQAVFRKYPDIVMAYSEKAESVLKFSGHTEGAEKVRQGLTRRVDGDRDDLTDSLIQEECDKLVQEGDVKGARRKLEKLMKDRVENGSKVFPLIRGYLKLTRETGQEKAAARFVEKYAKDIRRKSDLIASYEKTLYRLLAQAYENNGDEKELAETVRKIEQL